MRQVSCHVSFILCAIQRHETDIRPELRSVLQMAVKVVTLCSDYSAVLCEGIQAILPVLHSGRTWLLRGKGLEHVDDLKEVIKFLQTTSS